MSYKFDKPSTKDCLFHILTSEFSLCEVSFDDPMSPSRKNRVEINCLNCNEILLYCKICGYLTTAICHSEKELQKHQGILKMKGRFHLNGFFSTYQHRTETEYEHSRKQKGSISYISSTTSNELVEDNEESININFNINDASAFKISRIYQQHFVMMQ